MIFPEDLTEADWDLLEQCIIEFKTEEIHEFMHTDFLWTKKVFVQKTSGVLEGMVYSQLVRSLRADFKEIPLYINGGGMIQKGTLAFRLQVGK